MSRTSLTDEWMKFVADDIIEAHDSRAGSSSSEENTVFSLTEIIPPGGLSERMLEAEVRS